MNIDLHSGTTGPWAQCVSLPVSDDCDGVRPCVSVWSRERVIVSIIGGSINFSLQGSAADIARIWPDACRITGVSQWIDFDVQGHVEACLRALAAQQSEDPAESLSATLDLLSLVLPWPVGARKIARRHAKRWTQTDLLQAERWAARVHLRASNGDVHVPPEPSCVEKLRREISEEIGLNAGEVLR